MVLCSLRDTSGRTSAPFAVSLVTSSNGRPSRNLVRVVDLRRRASSHYHDAVNFSVCAPPIFGKFDDVAHLVEFIEVNRVFGAEKFQLYVESVGPHLSRCLQEYVRRGIVDVQQWNLPPDIARVVHYHGQIMAINDCLYRMMYTTRYLVIPDLDEFVVPMRSDNWLSMLHDINNEMIEDADQIASYSFRNRFFPTKSSKFSSSERQFKTLTVVQADRELFPYTIRSKVMARPERVLIWHVHLLLDSSLVHRGDINAGVDAKHAQLFHYRRDITVRNTTTLHRMKEFEPQIRRRLYVATAAMCLTGDHLFS